MYLKNIKNSKIYVCAVKAASFIDGSVGTPESPNELYIASHQIRIHNSYNTVFNLIARSNPIIEHCDQLIFSNLEKTDFYK